METRQLDSKPHKPRREVSLKRGQDYAEFKERLDSILLARLVGSELERQLVKVVA